MVIEPKFSQNKLISNFNFIKKKENKILMKMIQILDQRTTQIKNHQMKVIVVRMNFIFHADN